LAEDLRRRADFRRLHEKISIRIEKKLGVLCVGKSGEEENERRQGEENSRGHDGATPR